MKFRLSATLSYVLIVCIILFYCLVRRDSSSQEEKEVEALRAKLDSLQARFDNLDKGNADQRDQDTGVVAGQGNPKIGNVLGQQRNKAAEDSTDPAKVVLPILVIACDRTTVSRSLDALLRYNPDEHVFPIIVSQDCGHLPTSKVIQKYPSVTHIKQPDLSEIKIPGVKPRAAGYYKISRHYKWALTQVFDVLKHEAVIVVEDDLEISPDFYKYFFATYPLLKQDNSLFCVSAWNDNGKPSNIDETRPEKLYRTDFFPGLGWMMTKESFKELQPKWPGGYWDDWMRLPEQMKGRACIRPEVPRTSTFGKVGVSHGQFYNEHLKFIEHHKAIVHFTELDLSYLLKWNYDKAFEAEASSAPFVTLNDLKSKVLDKPAVRINYSDQRNFEAIAKALKIMSDFKSCVPRTGYHGIVTFMYTGVRVYLTPATLGVQSECGFTAA